MILVRLCAMYLEQQTAYFAKIEDERNLKSRLIQGASRYGTE